MRIIIELDAGASMPELQIVSQGKSQQGPSAAATTDTNVTTTDAGAPKYLTADPATQVVSSQATGQPAEMADNVVSAGAAPGVESL